MQQPLLIIFATDKTPPHTDSLVPSVHVVITKPATAPRWVGPYVTTQDPTLEIKPGTYQLFQSGIVYVGGRTDVQ